MKGDRETGLQFLSREPDVSTPVSTAASTVAAAVATAAWLAAAVLSSQANAVTLGGYEVQSALGQNLRMSVQVATTRPDEQIDSTCFRINPFSVAGDSLPQLTSAQLRLEQRGNEQRLLITSTRAIMDPIVRIAIDVGCDTTLRREITLLLDPPSAVETLPQVAEARPLPIPIPPTGTGASTNAPAARGSSSSASAPGGARAPGSTAASRPPRAPAAAPAIAPTARAPASQPVEPLAEVAPRPPGSLEAPASRLPANVPAPVARGKSSSDRLTISASPLPLESSGGTLSPQLNFATSLGDRGKQPMSESAMSMLRQKQARLRAAPAGEDLPSLEAEVVVLQKRTSEMQRQLNDVLSQMAALRGDAGGGSSAASGTAAPAATSPSAPVATGLSGPTLSTLGNDAAKANTGRPDKPWAAIWTDTRMIVLGPLAILLLMLILLFMLWLRRERDDQQRSNRWSHVPIGTEPMIPPVEAAPTIRPPDADPARPASAPVVGALVASGAAGSVDAGAAAEFKPAPAEGRQYKSYSSGQAAQELGVSDLAQATEKASVFVTLGRPAQAIDVLRDHIDHESKSSAMAWLMLLDLYRQTGRREDFDEVAQRFHNEFNAVTPAWNQPLAPLHDVGLGAFPYLIARIRDDWPNAAARAFIEELLYENRGGSRIGFSIPAFRDLLLLHSMVDEYLHRLENQGATDPSSGRPFTAKDKPTPPEHLASIWKTASPERPVYPTPLPDAPQPPASDSATELIDVAPIPEPPREAALETSYPIIAEAICNRWGQPGVAAYLSNLIRSSTDYGAGLTNEALAELVLLHDIALDLGEQELVLPLG